MPLFSHFAPGSVFAQKLKGFRSLFFRGINKTQNSAEMQKGYSECFAFLGAFRKNIRKIRKVYSRPKSTLDSQMGIVIQNYSRHSDW